MRTSTPLALAVLLPAVAAAQEGPRVAVLVEPGMVRYGGTPSISVEGVVPLLRKYGLDAETLTVDDIARRGRLSVAAFPVLVLPYGNAFPLPVFAQLRAYHCSGGCLVMNGVPFCHPCEKRDGKWRDMGHVDYFQHDARGIGTGGFRGPAGSGVLRIEHHGFQPNPLGMTDALPLPSSTKKRQWLDPSSLSPDDEVIPLQQRIETVGDDADLEEVYDTERHLLYVACTRARDHLLVTCMEPRSEFLDDLEAR